MSWTVGAGIVMAGVVLRMDCATATLSYGAGGAGCTVAARFADAGSVVGTVAAETCRMLVAATAADIATVA